MEVVKYRLNPFATVFEGFLKIGVHVTGNGLYSFHPVCTDMVNEVVYDLFLFPLGDPEDMAGLHIDDMSRVPVTVMKLEFIDPEILCLTFRLDELHAVNGVLLLKALLVDLLDDIPAQPGDLSNLFVGVCLQRQ